MLNDYENCVLDELMLEIKNDVLAQPQDNDFYRRYRYGAYRNDVLAQPLDNDYNRRHRCGEYRQYILWVHGQLGAVNRRGTPRSCVWRIREKYSYMSGQYVGFLGGRLG